MVTGRTMCSDPSNLPTDYTTGISVRAIHPTHKSPLVAQPGRAGRQPVGSSAPIDILTGEKMYLALCG